jgi:DNA-binding transcriptional ArsR family regulator
MGNVPDSAPKRKAKEFAIARETFVLKAMRDKGLLPYVGEVAYCLNTFFHYETFERDGTLYAFASQSQMAERLGMRQASISTALRKLEEAGHITVNRGGNGKRDTYLGVRTDTIRPYRSDEATTSEPIRLERIATDTVRPDRTDTIERIAKHSDLPSDKHSDPSSLRSDEEKKEAGEGALRAPEPVEGPSSSRQTSSAEPVLIDTPEQKARVEEMRQMFLRLLRPMPGARSREVPRDSTDQMRLDKAMITHGRPRLENLSQRLDKFRRHDSDAAA